MPQLADVRACLDLDSMRLLDQCAAALEEADLLELLLEQLERLAEGLEAREASDDDCDVVRYRFSDMSEVMLLEFIRLAQKPHLTIADRRSAMQATAVAAGFVA